MNKAYESDGAKLAYVDTGAGLPGSFCIPWPVDHAYWLPMMEEALGGRAPFFPTCGVTGCRSWDGCRWVGLRGSRRARADDGAIATDILTLMDHLHLRQWLPAARLAATLRWGAVAQSAGSDTRAGICVLEAPAGCRGQPGEARSQHRTGQSRWNERDVRRDGEYPEWSDEPRASSGDCGRVARRITLTPEAVVAVQAGLAARPDSTPTVATIEAPVLAIAGGEDQGIAPGRWRPSAPRRGDASFTCCPMRGIWPPTNSLQKWPP